MVVECKPVEDIKAVAHVANVVQSMDTAAHVANVPLSMDTAAHVANVQDTCVVGHRAR